MLIAGKRLKKHQKKNFHKKKKYYIEEALQEISLSSLNK